MGSLFGLEDPLGVLSCVRPYQLTRSPSDVNGQAAVVQSPLTRKRIVLLMCYFLLESHLGNGAEWPVPEEILTSQRSGAGQGFTQPASQSVGRSARVSQPASAASGWISLKRSVWPDTRSEDAGPRWQAFGRPFPFLWKTPVTEILNEKKKVLLLTNIWIFAK